MSYFYIIEKWLNFTLAKPVPHGYYHVDKCGLWYVKAQGLHFMLCEFLLLSQIPCMKKQHSNKNSQKTRCPALKIENKCHLFLLHFWIWANLSEFWHFCCCAHTLLSPYFDYAVFRTSGLYSVHVSTLYKQTNCCYVIPTPTHLF